MALFRSTKEFIVPEGARTNSDVPVDWGTVELKPITLPVFMDVKTNAGQPVGR